MLYLEDYVEMIEHLPQELRDRFTEMRELDLQVQNSMDSLEKRVNVFFNNAKRMKIAEKDAEFDVIKKDYCRTLEDADEKVQLANNMYELVAKYYRRLEQELHKFKMELEADNMGITEILEKRSQEKESVPATNSSHKENRYSSMIHHQHRTQSYYGEKAATQRRDSSEVKAANAALAREPALAPSYSTQSAIAAAAYQAIAATQQMPMGRRTASLKASYQALGGAALAGATATPLEISREIAGAAQTAIAAAQDRKHKGAAAVAATVVGTGGASVSGGRRTTAGSPVSLPSPATPDRTDYDPNEPRYCICNEVAFGTMVACDSKSCPYEWYHYPCVGITEKPKGKWYCPHCTAVMKRRNRKN